MARHWAAEEEMSMSKVTVWPWVDIDFPGRASFREEAGSITEERAQAGREAALRFRSMRTAELHALEGTRMEKEEATAFLTEGALRGLLDETVQAKLLGLLREEEEARLAKQEEVSFRAQHAGMSRVELALAMAERGRV
jgi:hypothetical protein